MITQFAKQRLKITKKERQEFMNDRFGKWD